MAITTYNQDGSVRSVNGNTNTKLGRNSLAQLEKQNLSSNPSASSPALNTPAAQSFIQNQMQSVNPTLPTTPVAPTQTSQQSTQQKPEQSAYIKYLTGMFDPKNVSTAQKAAEQANKKLADIQNEGEAKSLSSRREYERLLDTPGGLKIGAQESATMANRRNNSELADIALRESAAARSAGVYNDVYKTAIQAGASLYEAEQAAEKARKEDERYQNDFGLEKEKLAYNKEQDKIQNDLAQKKFDEDVRQFGITSAIERLKATGGGSGVPGVDGQLSNLARAVQNGTIALDKLPAEDRARVAAELANAGIPSTRQQTLSANLDVVNSLLANDRLSSITGLQSPKVLIPGTKAQLAKNQYNQLKGILSLENREKLKGSGAISDFEFKVLSDAATALGRNLSDADFRTQLTKVKDVFEGKYANTNATSGSTSGTTSGITSSGIKYTVED